MSTWYLKGVITGYVAAPDAVYAVVLVEPEHFNSKECDEEKTVIVPCTEPRRLVDVPLRDLHVLSVE